LIRERERERERNKKTGALNYIRDIFNWRGV
jgi:hypothetical protein